MWPDESLAIKGGPYTFLSDLPSTLVQTTQQRLAKLQALEDSGVQTWNGYDSAMDHLQNLQRNHDNDAFDQASAAMTPDLSGEVPRPPLDLAEDDVLIEECGEVIQAVCKVRRFGRVNHLSGKDNIAALEVELGQLLTAIEKLSERWALSAEAVSRAAIAKERAMTEWARFYERNR